MIYNRFQGDPAVKITEDGAKMKFINGQPVMDQGLVNAVLISLFSRRGYWGNSLITEESKKIGSDVEKTALEPIVNIQSINNMTDAIDKALSWMTDTKLSQENEINVTNPNSNTVPRGNSQNRLKALIIDVASSLFTPSLINKSLI